MKHYGILPLLAIFLFMGCKNGTRTTGDGDGTSVDRPITNVKNDQELTSPLTIEVRANHAWKAFEGELGHVSLLDSQGKEIARGILANDSGDWMTNGDAVFTATLFFDNTERQKGSLVFTNNIVSKEGTAKEASFTVPVTVLPGTSQESGMLGGQEEQWCFALREKADHVQEGEFSYHLIRFKKGEGGKVSGMIISAPYGTDGSKGNFSGMYDEKSNTFIGKETLLAEGELYTEDRTYRLEGDRLYLGYKGPGQKEASLPKVTCTEFEGMHLSYESGTTMDLTDYNARKRLPQLAVEENWGLTETQMQDLNAMEIQVELDGDHTTKEYLFYPTGNGICGTGGCTLYVFDGQDRAVARIGLVKLPVYTYTERIGTEKGPGTWKALIVWSDGAYRSIEFKNGSYAKNASLAKKIADQDPEYHPEKYDKVLMN